MKFEQGNALGLELLAHRANFNGTICQDPRNWDCGAPLEFRERHCANNSSRCHHLHVFDTTEPGLRVRYDQLPIQHTSERVEQELCDQVLFLLTKPVGLQGVTTGPFQVAGIYRIQTVSVEGRQIHLRPYADGWCDLGPLKIRAPQHAKVNSSTWLMQIPREEVLRIRTETLARLNSGLLVLNRNLDVARAERCLFELEGWLKGASQGQLEERLFSRLDSESVRAEPHPSPRAPGSTALTSYPAGRPAEPKRGLPLESQDSGQLFSDSEARNQLSKIYGPTTTNALRVACATKPLVILRGSPGVGKSYVATRLLPRGLPPERVLIVAVDPTWTSRDDLLGYVTPHTGFFEPTPFTNFLRNAAIAWRRGERGDWVIVMEELNISTPEHWLSEVLVRSEYGAGQGDEAYSEYDAEQDRDRIIELGGSSVRGWPEHEPPSVFLSPALRMVATINSDHTTQPLSPRVLDRAAIVEISLSARKAIFSAGNGLSPEQVQSVTELDAITRPWGGAVTIRVARSLRRASRLKQRLGLEPWAVVDHVLAHEVLEKVSLAGFMSDAPEQRKDVATWVRRYSDRLPVCESVISGWLEQAELGMTAGHWS